MAYSDIDSGKVLNKEGLLELCSQIKTEIANNSGGGSSYTAGDGINIDSNGVINREKIDLGEPIFSLFNSGLIPNFSPGTNWGSYNSLSNLINGLNQNKVAQTSASFGWVSFSIKDINDALGTNYVARKFSQNTTTQEITNEYLSATSTVNLNSGARESRQLMIVGNEIWVAQNLKAIFGYSLGQVINIKYYNQDNYTHQRLDQIIDDLDTAISSKQDAIIPAAPTTDGTYTLQCVVSSGTPTYSWVSA